MLTLILHFAFLVSLICTSAYSPNVSRLLKSANVTLNATNQTSMESQGLMIHTSHLKKINSFWDVLDPTQSKKVKNYNFSTDQISPIARRGAALKALQQKQEKSQILNSEFFE